MAKRKSKLVTAQTVIREDCVTGLQKLDKGSAFLGIADPPYNCGKPYDAYEDNKSYDEYIEWTRSWLAAMTHALHKHGALWIFAPDDWVSEIDLMARKEFSYYKQNHIVWYFTFGQAQQARFTPSHCHLLWLTRTKTRFTFNPDVLRVPSARQAIYNDKRANAPGKLPDDTWVLYKHQLEPLFKPDMATWLENRICGTFKEREKTSPNQIPIPIMSRIVQATSDEGDLVVDAFCGTGSAGVASAIHNRSYIGYDLSKACVTQAKKRITETLKKVS